LLLCELQRGAVGAAAVGRTGDLDDWPAEAGESLGVSLFEGEAAVMLPVTSSLAVIDENCRRRNFLMVFGLRMSLVSVVVKLERAAR